MCTDEPVGVGMDQRHESLIVPGETCWRTAAANRYAAIVDGADYLRHVKAAMLNAHHRIVIIGWDLDYRTAFERGETTLEGPNHLGPFLHWLLWKRRELNVYLLKSNLRLLPAFDGFWFGVAPVSLLNQFTSARMHFAVDGVHPTGAVHHQKIVVVDDAVAFCGGIDLTIGRWDTRAHLPVDPRRHGPGDAYGPRHEVAAVVDGAAAQLLAQQAHERWEAATGRALAKDVPFASAWPEGLSPSLRNVEVGVARTLPALPQRGEVREIEALDLAAIAAARDVIYLENQYFASRSIAEAIAARLREAHGPEVVIILPRSSESRLEQESMDSARERLVRMLQDGRPARAVGGLLAGGRQRRVGIRALEGHRGRRPSASYRLLELQQPITGLRQRMRHCDRSQARAREPCGGRARDPLHPRQSRSRASGRLRRTLPRRSGAPRGIPAWHRRAAQYRSFAAKVDRHDGLR